MNDLLYRPLSQAQAFRARSDGNSCVVSTEDDQGLRTRFILEADRLLLTEVSPSAGLAPIYLLVALEYLLGHHPEVQRIQLETPLPLLGSAFERSQFFQLPALWHHRGAYQILPEKWTSTSERRHPVRPVPHNGEVYRRFVPLIGKTVSLRLIDGERDLEVFTEWHNQPRVSFYWELNRPKEELRDYIAQGLEDPHQIPLIAEIDGEPVGYFEAYWVREDRLGPYYDSDPFDRGFHFLIGSKTYLGAKFTDSIIRSALHFLYLDEARSRRVMAEPRHDNQKVLKYAEAAVGWRKVKLFDFPHKRAWLLENSREIFFEGNAL